jgi:hypothetical protein
VVKTTPQALLGGGRITPKGLGGGSSTPRSAVVGGFNHPQARTTPQNSNPFLFLAFWGWFVHPRSAKEATHLANNGVASHHLRFSFVLIFFVFNYYYFYNF